MFGRMAYKAKLIILVAFLMARVSSVFAFSYREYATGIEVNMTDTISYNSLWGADEPNSLKMLNLIYDPNNNLCPNGDFEIEGLANWTPITTGDVTITLQEENGNNVVAINRPTTGYGMLSSDLIPVTCIYKYVILWSAKINENGYMPMLRISAYDYNKQFLSYSYQQHFPAYNSWKKYYAIIPLSCKMYYLKIDLFLYNQGGTVYFDDIQIIRNTELLSGAYLGANMYAVSVIEDGNFFGGGHGKESNINLAYTANSDFINVIRTAECPYFNTTYQTIYDNHTKKIYETMKALIVRNFSSNLFHASMQADNKFFQKATITLSDDSVIELTYRNLFDEHFYEAKKIIQTDISGNFNYTHMLVLDPQYITHALIKDYYSVKKLYGWDSNTVQNYTAGQTVFLRTFHMWEEKGFDWNSVSTEFPDIVVYPSGSYYLHPTVNPSSFSLTIPDGSINVAINTWLTSDTYYKKWTEDVNTSGITATHTISDLEINTYYIVKINGTRLNTFLSNPLGQITFTCNSGYPVQTFEVEEDPAPPPRADINGDFIVNFVDFSIFASNWLTNDCEDTNFWCHGADIDENGAVDIVDMTDLITHWLWMELGTQADLNMSGSIDFDDFATFADLWSKDCNSPSWCFGSDFDKSGQVNCFDLAEFSEFWFINHGF